MTTATRPFTAASFYAFLKEGKLMGVQCRACGKAAAEARPLCPSCHSREVEWRQFSGQGTLSAFTCISIVPQGLAALGYGRDNPYCSGIVTLAEGPRVSARIVGVDARRPQSIAAGLPVILDFSEFDPERPAVTFRPV